MPRLRKQQGGAERAKRFGHLRFGQMLRDEFDAARRTVAQRIGESSALRHVAIGILERRNDGERRQAGERLNVIGGFDRVVHVLAQKRETDAARDANEERQ
jgi:hypothetical protein